MNKQHTPGPWVAWRDGAVGPTSKEEDQSFGMLLPVAYVEDSDWPESADANARLIAAAPELLEACLAMIEWDDRENDHAVNFHKRMELCELSFQKARAAIAKATGENT